MKLLKRLVKPFIVLLIVCTVLVLGALALLPSYINTQSGKTQVCSLVSSLIGRRVECRGALQLSVGSITSLRITDLDIAQPAGFAGEKMLSVARFEISVPIVTTLFSHPTVDSLLLENLEIRIDSVVSGASNWTFGEEKAASTESTSRAIVVPLLKQASIRDLNLTINSPGKSSRVALREFDVKADEGGNGIELTAQGDLNSLPLTLKGRVASVSGLLSGESTGIEAALVSGKNSFKTSGKINLDGEFQLGALATGEDFSTFGDPLLSGLPAWKPYSIEVAATSSRGSKMLLKDLKAKLGKVEVQGGGTLGGLQGAPFSLETDLSLPRQGIRAKVKMGNTGDVEVMIDGSLEHSSELGELFLHPIPVLPPITVNADLVYLPVKKGQVSDAVDIRRLSLVLAKSDVEGAGRVQLKPLKLEGLMKSKVLDYAEVLKVASHFSKERDEPGSVRPTKSEAWLPFESLQGIEVVLGVSIEKLSSLIANDIEGVHVTAKVSDGDLLIPKVLMRVFGGQITGEMRAATTGSSFKIDVKQLDSIKVSEAFGGNAFVDGKFDIVADLRASGHSVGRLLETVSGPVALSSADAQFKSQAVSLSASGLHRILAPVFNRGPRTPSECILLDFTVKDGVATAGGNVINMGDVFLFGRGNIDLTKNTIQYSFNVNSANPSLASLIPPFKAVGALKSPFFVPSTAGTVASVFDSAEGVFDSAVGMVESTARFVLSAPGEKVEGTALCKRALDLESRRMSSRVGGMLSNRNP